MAHEKLIAELEEYGFVKPGEGGPFAADGELCVDGGSLPSNTSGGCLSEAYVHGMNLVLEAVRQLRSESVNQLSRCETALVTSGNGVPTSALILRSDT